MTDPTRDPAPLTGRDEPRDESLERALRKAGGTTKLAKALGITKGAVSQWRAVPVRFVERVNQLYGISQDRLLAPHLRPQGPKRIETAEEEG